MKITTTKTELGEVVGSGVERSRDHRPHLTEVIKYIESMTGKGYRDDGVWQRVLMFECGFMWEEVIEEALSKRYGGELIRPGEVELDEVVGSPDGVRVVDGEWVVHEYKFTWKSARRPIDNDNAWYYLTQLKSYCYMLGASKAVLHVLYINGDYKTERPCYREYEIEFSEEELESNWVMIVNAAKDIERRRNVGTCDK
jgi:hypothetical protein